MLPVIYGNVNVFFHNNFTSFLCIIYNFCRIFPFFILFFQSFGNILSLIAHPSPISVRTIRFVPIFPFLFFPKNLLKKRPPSNTSHHIGQGAVFIYHILILSPIKKIWKQHGESRNKCKKQQYQNHAQIEWKGCLGNLFYRQMGNCR